MFGVVGATIIEEDRPIAGESGWSRDANDEDEDEGDTVWDVRVRAVEGGGVEGGTERVEEAEEAGG